MLRRLLFFFVLTATLFAAVLPVHGQSFFSSDLAGTWYGHQLVTGDEPADNPRWGYGRLVIDSAGNYTSTWTDPNQVNVVSSGSIQINFDGIITINNQVLTHGVINDRKDMIVLIDGTAIVDGNALTILLKRDAEVSFSTADLAGTWYGHEIFSGDAPGENPQWGYGRVTIDNGGDFTGTWTDHTETEAISGSVAITASGMVTVSNQPLTHGVMNDDKNLIVLIDGPPSVSGSAINILIKRGSSQTFGIGDLSGSWYGHHIVSGDINAGDDPRWGHGTAEIESNGQYTVDWASPTKMSEITNGTIQLTENGILTINNEPLTHGILNDAKDLFIFIDGTDESAGNALGVFVKRAPLSLSGSIHLLLNPIKSE